MTWAVLAGTALLAWLSWLLAQNLLLSGMMSGLFLLIGLACTAYLRVGVEGKLSRWASRVARCHPDGEFEAVIRVVKSSNFMGWRGFELHLGRFTDQDAAFAHAREHAPHVEAYLDDDVTYEWGVHFLARRVPGS